MSRPKTIDTDLVAKAEHTLQHSSAPEEMRQALAVLLPAKALMTVEQTAAFLGVGRATVNRLQTRFRTDQSPDRPTRKTWGGRRRSLLTEEEERDFLEQWVQEAARGGVLVISPIRAALAQRLGKPVTYSVVNRLLARHGWRKVAPDTRHPKSDPRVQEEWKKNCRKVWTPF
jgi:transposase